VIIGSNVFNLAALLGLAAVVAGWIAFHRRVVLLGGVPAVWVAAVTLLTVTVVTPAAGLALIAVVFVPCVAVLGMRRAQLEALPLPARWIRWLVAAIHEEEAELAEAVKPRRGTWRDAVAAAVALVAVVGASTVMELAATAVGHRYGVADIVTGGLVLAIVTSLPNAVAAVYLARRGRGAAVLSIALNSNAINVVAGLLIPATIAGLGPPSGQGTLVAAWYAGMTVLALALAYRGRGLGRAAGAVIIAGYLAFVAALLIAVAQGGVRPVTALFPAAVIAAAGAVLLAWPDGRRREESLLPGWSVGRLWRLSLVLSAAIAAGDAASGPHLILMGGLIAGPFCALLTSQWALTAAATVVDLALGGLLGVPDQIFATVTQYACLALVAAVGAAATVGAAVLRRRLA
jgi:cation:H+ antiporter